MARSEDGDEHYPLDDHPRHVPENGKLTCPTDDLVRYSGEIIRYSSPVRIHWAFRKRLKRFEQVVADVSTEIYGRIPRRIVQRGSYSCRQIRGIPGMMSEHALGNAIDVYGFDFGAFKKGDRFPKGLSKRLKRPFKVRLLKHREARSKVGKVHSSYLNLLADKLIQRDDIFRVLLGPAYPGHANHFHFDCANYRLISI